MEITPDTAFAASQIIAILLVATLLDPWAKTALAKDANVNRKRRFWAWLTYLAKVLAITVLFFDMQVALFDSTRDGTAGLVLVWANYAAIWACGMSVLLTVLNHLGAYSPDGEETAQGKPEAEA